MKHFNRIAGILLPFVLLLTLNPPIATYAASTTYAVSGSYASSSFYSNLSDVKLTGNERTDIVNIALSQLGYYEGYYSGDYDGGNSGTYDNYCEYNYWYHNYVNSGMPVGGSSAPWCATFVSWCARQAGVSTSTLANSTAAGHGSSYFNINYAAGGSQGSDGAGFLGNNYIPQPGGLFYKSDWSHVGLVWYVSGDYFYTIEGNTNNNGSSQGNGVYSLKRKIADCYFGVPNYTTTSITHTIDTSYGTNFTAYPKAKITASNIFNASHTQIDSTSWIGTSDNCTIHEVYTDGCCKVTYPLDAGGTKTVYSKISLFNTHVHSYTGARIYESAHPHRISQRCKDYATCGGWVWTDEYYEVKTCEQCWHADFDIGASSISIKVGESKTVAATLSGCLPDSAVMYRSVVPDNGIVEVVIKNQQATFTGLKEGTTSLTLTVYSDSSKAHDIGSITIPVTVTPQTYTITYNANGGTGAPSSQTKYYNTALTLSRTAPSRPGYTFLGWSTSSSATSASYQPGGSFTGNSNTVLYAVWKKGCESGLHDYSGTITSAPTASASGQLKSICSLCSDTITVTLPKLNTTDYNYTIKKQPTYTEAGTGCYTWKNTAYGLVTVDVVIPATVIPGDINGDGAVTDADAIHLLYHSLLPELYPVEIPCDYNGDGAVTDADAIYLLYHTLLPDLYPLN